MASLVLSVSCDKSNLTLEKKKSEIFFKIWIPISFEVKIVNRCVQRQWWICVTDFLIQFNLPLCVKIEKKMFKNVPHQYVGIKKTSWTLK